MGAEIFIAMALGICAGIITGLIPGIHVNLVSALVLSASGFLLTLADLTTLSVFIISMAVIHTFLDAIPSIYLGAPDTDMAMGVLPGHRMLLQGKGYEAVKLTVIGSFLSLIFVLLFSPLLIFLMGRLDVILERWIGWILAAIVVWMVSREKSKTLALAVFLLSGVLGISVLNMSIKQPLFPMLSGLFGLSTLLSSLNENTKIPKQRIQKRSMIKKKPLFYSSLAGGIVGSLAGFFPGLGPAQAAAAGSQVLKESNKNFLVLVGGISTANMIASLVTFFTLDKARNGAIVAVRELLGEISIRQFVLFMAVALIVGSIAVMLTLFFAKKFAGWMQNVDYRKVCMAVILLIVALAAFLSGWLGLVVLIVSTSIGMLAPLLKVSRSHAMGCLLLPVILWFLL